jgi:hypothetical protein
MRFWLSRPVAPADFARRSPPSGNGPAAPTQFLFTNNYERKKGNHEN